MAWKLSQGSVLGQSQGLPHLFPVFQGLPPSNVSCPLSWKLSVHVSCLIFFFRWEYKPVPVAPSCPETDSVSYHFANKYVFPGGKKVIWRGAFLPLVTIQRKCVTKYVTLSLMEGLDLWLVLKGTICGLKGKFYVSQGYGSQGIISSHGSVGGSPSVQKCCRDNHPQLGPVVPHGRTLFLDGEVEAHDQEEAQPLPPAKHLWDTGVEPHTRANPWRELNPDLLLLQRRKQSITNESQNIG